MDHGWLASMRDGLKVGRNVLMVESWDSTGRYAVKRWTITVNGSRPLAEAGPAEKVVAPNRWIGLDGSKSRATKRGATLSYAWRVVSAPKGAKPQLRDRPAPRRGSRPTCRASIRSRCAPRRQRAARTPRAAGTRRRTRSRSTPCRRSARRACTSTPACSGRRPSCRGPSTRSTSKARASRTPPAATPTTGSNSTRRRSR